MSELTSDVSISRSGPTGPRLRARLPALVGLFCLSLFALLTVGVMRFRWFADWDAAYKDGLHVHATGSPLTVGVFAGVTALASERMLGIEALALLILLAFARRWRWCAVWLLAFAGNQIVLELKALVDRPRPLFVDPIITEATRSFPSGHTAGATIFFGMLAYFVTLTIPKLRMAVITLAGWMVLAIGFSRIYLGVHWLSDVIGGLLFGLAWVMVCIALANAWQPRSSLP